MKDESGKRKTENGKVNFLTALRIFLALICCQKCVVALHRAKKQRRIVQNVQPPLGFKRCDANACFSLQIFVLSINNNSKRPVVYKADLHIGAELTGFDFGAEQLL